MVAFRALLIVIFLAIVIYTVPVVAEQGWNLFPDFFGDIARGGWPGQFNLDFLCMLALSALWVSWRHRFTPSGLALGTLAFFGGALFLSVYLFALTFRVSTERELLVGERRG